MINAILWMLRTGAPWRDLPERYGPWKTAHERLWTADGTWQPRYGKRVACYQAQLIITAIILWLR